LLPHLGLPSPLDFTSRLAILRLRHTDKGHAFELDGQSFTALNGGPIFKFNEAISFQVNCETQEEVDYYWEKLSDSGEENAQQRGWLKHKYGASWQVVPSVLLDMINDPDSERSQRAMEAMLQMKKIDIDESGLNRIRRVRKPALLSGNRVAGGV
jgi:predicted 3-demethylubiquinone-9 3-methyltransferase (glyoxalase superfamily)